MTRHVGDELVVLSQNAWGGGPGWKPRCQRLARDIATLGPDIVGLQEIHATEPTGAHSQAHEIAALLKGYDAYFAPARVEPDGHCEGVAVLCRRDVREHSIESLTLDMDDVLDRAGQRVVLCANVDLPEGPVDVFVTHLSLSKRARARTLLELLAFTERERHRSRSIAAVLMGDFNALPHEPALLALEGSEAWPNGAWQDVWKATNPARARGGTWPAIAPFRRIDYVFVQPSTRWRMIAADVAPLSGSDHRGVVARLKLRDPHAH